MKVTMPKLPLYAKVLLYVCFFPMALAGCQTVKPKMPPAIKYSYSGPHGDALFYDGPCAPIVLQLIPPEHRAMFRGGEGIYDGENYVLCWAPHPSSEDAIFLLWEDGGMGGLGKEILKPGTGV